MQRNYDLQKEVDTKARELQLTELQVQSLAFEQRYYQTDEYKELAVRERLGLSDPGEKVLVLPPNTITDSDSRQMDARTRLSSPSNLQQWVDFLFGGNSRSLQ